MELLKCIKSLSKEKIITSFHKYYKFEDYVKNKVETFNKNYYMISTGISESDWISLEKLINYLDPFFVCVDVANGYMHTLMNFVKKLHSKYPNITIVCGNVVTREMVEELIINGGVDIVKVGIGNGSVCTTRLKTGVGMPQLSAILECADAAHGVGGHIISDGGICVPGDIGKAFGAGADFVMMGSMFAGHYECSGEIIEEEGIKYKIYYGMSSSISNE